MDQEKIILSLIERGWYTSESFFDPLLCKALQEELHTLPLKESKIGKGSSEQISLDIRNDSLYWLDEKSGSLAQQEYLEEMNKLMIMLNHELFLGLKQYEGHFAKYTQNGFYKKHLDQFKGNKERIVTVINYLNTPQSGGELRIYSRENPDIIEADVLPKMGRLVCFLSDQIYHEVLPTTSERYSVTGWLRTTIL